MNSQVTEYIDKAPPEQQAIMNVLRELIHESVPGVSEEFKWSRPVFKAAKDFTYLKTAKAHVTLGFYNFDKIEDKGNRLEGTGSAMRHVKIKTLDDIDRELFGTWFRQITE